MEHCIYYELFAYLIAVCDTISIKMFIGNSNTIGSVNSQYVTPAIEFETSCAAINRLGIDPEQ